MAIASASLAHKAHKVLFTSLPNGKAMRGVTALLENSGIA